MNHLKDSFSDTSAPRLSHAQIYVFGGFGFIVVYLIWKLHDAFFGPLSKIPGPKLYAMFDFPGIIDEIRGNQVSVITSLHAKYGPIVRISPERLSFVGDGQTWNDVYGFRKAGQSKPFKDPRIYKKELNGFDSIVSANDADHSRMRKILAHAFSDKALRSQETILKGWVSKLLGKLSEQAKQGATVDLLKYYNCTTFDVMGDLTFGENLNMLDNGELNSWVKTIFESIKIATIVFNIARIHPLFKWFISSVLMNSNAVKQKAEAHFAFSKDRLDRRLARTTDRPDFWTTILAKSKGDGPDGLRFEEQHTNASIFMIAGTETTATALSGTTYHLLRNPAKLDRLTTEVRTNFSSFSEITLDKLIRLPYLHAVLQEGLRMYPPVPSGLMRTTPPGGCEIHGEWVPGDVGVAVHHFATYMSESNFHKADEFHPERYLGEDERFKGDRLDALEPFMVGPRNCIGKNLAWLEMKLILTSVLLEYDLELLEESERWSDQKVYSLWEKVPLMCKLKAVSQG